MVRLTNKIQQDRDKKMRKSQHGASYIAILFGVIFLRYFKAAVAIWPVYWDDKLLILRLKELLKKVLKCDTSKFYTQDE